MIFADRVEAGERLAVALSRFKGADAVVLAIPRGGVIVGEAVARALGLPLDVVVPRKIGAPGNPELGLGAIAPGVRVLDRWLIERLGVSQGYLDREIEAQEREIDRRERAYRAGRPPVDVAGRGAIVVDDGVATGGTAVAALRWARAAGASPVVLAVPVAPPASVERLAEESDEVVVLATPEPFFAVGEWYRRFDQTTDEEVVAALARAAREVGG
ncbi:MAG TPA: phosphoribosyltransferase family protein [Actinomycetota bacterium]|nr:phosphoribosyltransferase family protein [Actinomycetota bacterium]